MCGVDGCQSIFHHLCQTEWKIHQYHLDYPNGDPQDCIYDSGGKKRCVHHHSHGNLAINPPLAGQSQQLHSDSMPASKRMEVSDGIANVPPIVEDEGDQNKETTQSNSNNADINPNEVIRSNVEEEVEVNNMASQESYPNFSPKDVKESGNINRPSIGDDNGDSDNINTKEGWSPASSEHDGLDHNRL